MKNYIWFEPAKGFTQQRENLANFLQLGDPISQSRGSL